MIIAIDGPAASGKGTLARGLAAALGFAHLDTGMIYRAVAARVLAAGEDPHDAAAALRAAQTLEAADLRRGDLRRQDVGQGASVVAAIPEVRAALLAFQRDFAAQPPDGREGAVLDGRDVGTVVCRRREEYIRARPARGAGP
jgi:cytidylate kinase